LGVDKASEAGRGRSGQRDRFRERLVSNLAVDIRRPVPRRDTAGEEPAPRGEAPAGEVELREELGEEVADLRLGDE
jgi:hypothetical protein